MYEALTYVADIAVFFCIYAIIALSLNFQYGYTGIFNLGLLLPILTGALVVAYLPGRLAMMIYGVDQNLDFVVENALVLDMLKAKLQIDPIMSVLLLLVTMIAVIGVSSFLGYVSSYPALKLSADYLALFMLVLAESLRLIGMQTDWMAGGVFGIAIIDVFWWLGSYAYYGSSSLVIASTTLVYLIHHRLCASPVGRLLRAVREDELTTECVGKDVRQLKKKVLTFSFAVLGVAGALQALTIGAVAAEGYSRVDFSFWPWLMVMVGGTGNNLGVLAGTFTMVIMRRLMIVVKNYFTFLPFNVIFMEPILLGLMLMFILIYRPAGLLPERPLKLEQYLRKTLQTELQSEEQPAELRVSS